MNYLELCRRTAQECGITATTPVPTGVTDQIGELKRIVDWVKEAYNEIQTARSDWRWMRKPFTLTTVPGTRTYAYGDAEDDQAGGAIERFARWYLDDPYLPPRMYQQSAGVGSERWLIYAEWEWFSMIYRRGTVVQGPPAYIAVDPDNRIWLGPSPDDIYVGSGDFYRNSQDLSEGTDPGANVPEMPPHFHMLIVYEAMKKYAGYESAQEVMVRATREASSLWTTLKNSQLPKVSFAPPLA